MTASAPSLPLQDKVALISGASRGIGKAIAKAFIDNGARVMLAARSVEALRTLAVSLDPSGLRAQAVAMDLSLSHSIEAAVAATVSAFGRLDLAVNNAGVQIRRVPLIELEDDEFDQLMQINLRGVFVAMKHEIKAMLATGGGAIVNVSSSAGLVGIPLIAPYTASKHGVIGLTKVAALEYATQGIRVNALAPGTTMTEMFRKGPASTPEAIAAMTGRVPMKRIAEPEEIAQAAVWLCSDAASYVTGATLPVDGGYVVP